MTGAKRLLVVADTIDGGLGAAAVVQARSFQRAGWTVWVAAPEANGIPRDVPSEQVPVPGTAFDAAGMWTASRTLRAVIRRTRPTIVHAHGTRSQALCLMADRRRPYVTYHGAGRLPGQSALSSAVRAGFLAAAPVLAARAFSVSPGTGPGWTTLVSASPTLAGLEQRDRGQMSPDPLFVWVGRPSPQKRADVFIRAMSRLRTQVPRARGLLLGDGPELRAVTRLNDELGRPVEILGAVDDVPELLRPAWGFCLFSRFEGVPFSLQEAMWLGVAPVVTPLPGNQWLAGGSAAYASEPTDVARALKHLCHPEMAWNAGSEAAQQVRRLVRVDDPHDQLAQVYGGRRRRT